MANQKYSLKYKKELYCIFLIVILGGILLLSFMGPDGYFELKEARRKLQSQRALVDELERSNAERMKTIEELRSNREAIKRYALELGYGWENEIIQQLPENPDKKP